MKILVTGAAGFIGAKLVQLLAERGYDIVGLDNINSYYDINLKYGRLMLTGIRQNEIENNKIVASHKYPNYRFIKLDLEDNESLLKLFKGEKFNRVCNLAAQAGVRYSITNPYAYINSNIVGFLNILEGCRHNEIAHLIYASSSSVYGMNMKVPFSEKDEVAHPVSLYAATKRANELMAHSYSKLYNLPTTGLRFFTVYGPWGRPDMAPFLFTDAIIKDNPIKIFNNGDMLRDFTYIDDIAEGVSCVIDSIAKPNPDWYAMHPDLDSSSVPFRIYNIGNSQPIRLMDFIHTIEESLGKTANKVYYPMQPGDVYQTNANVSSLEKTFNFRPKTDIKEGISNFIEWYKEFYGGK